MYDFFSLPPAERLTRIIDGMFLSITRRGMPGFRLVPIPNLLLTLIWNRLARLKQRLLRALATPYIPRRHKPGSARKARVRPQPASPYTVPRYKAWLLHLIQETGGAGTQLAHCLNQPDAIALIEADPRLGRILRPFCHALGVRPHGVPVLYPKRAPKAPPAAPEPEAKQPEANQAAPVANPATATSPPAASPPQATPPSPSSRAPPPVLA